MKGRKPETVKFVDRRGKMISPFKPDRKAGRGNEGNTYDDGRASSPEIDKAVEVIMSKWYNEGNRKNLGEIAELALAKGREMERERHRKWLDGKLKKIEDIIDSFRYEDGIHDKDVPFMTKGILKILKGDGD